MALPTSNVQQCDSADGSRAQVSYLCAHTAVACSHFYGASTATDLNFFRMDPPATAEELRINATLPDVGDPVHVLWEEKGFACVRAGRVSKLNPSDSSFAVFLGWTPPGSVQGVSGALCWDGAVRGIVTGVQRDLKTTHVWVQTVPSDCVLRRSGYLSL